MSRLLYVGQQVADDLRKNVFENITRYRDGDFLDLEAAGDWRIPLSVNVDPEELSRLVSDGRPEDEIRNSLRVGAALADLTPTLARENRIWIRLSHIECLEYSRKRWLSSNANADDEKLEDQIRIHFFAPTLTACRDDHSIAKLWWNHHIARQVMPENPERALKMILARADIRSNIVERPTIGARPGLGRGIVRLLEQNEVLRASESQFREFMKKLNLLGAGVAFEVWNDEAIDHFMKQCL